MFNAVPSFTKCASKNWLVREGGKWRWWVRYSRDEKSVDLISRGSLMTSHTYAIREAIAIVFCTCGEGRGGDWFEGRELGNDVWAVSVDDGYWVERSESLDSRPSASVTGY